MNFLQICQMVARESGTISGTQPTTTQNQSGRLLKIVNWVADAWTQIQNKHASWKFMRQPFPASAATIANVQLYPAATLAITDFGEWIVEKNLLSVYDPTIGTADETVLLFLDWDQYRRFYVQGAQTPDRPQFYSVSPSDQLALGPIPDKVYTIRGEYRQTAQALQLDTDIPSCPARFHGTIAWKALLRLDQADEATPDALAGAQVHYDEDMSALERDQLPRFKAFVEPLA